MQRQRGELVPIGEFFDRLSGPVQALRDATPQPRHHFTQADQLVSASEADPDLGFMGRTMALCSLPRSNPGNRPHRNGPTTKPNPKPEVKPRIAAAKRRVKPLARLLRCASGPAGDSAPRLRLKAAGMAERFLSARPHGPNAPVWGVMISNAIK